MRHFLLLATCLLSAAALAQPELKPIKADQTWGAGSTEQLQTLFEAAAKTFLTRGNMAADAPIIVQRNKDWGSPTSSSVTPGPGGERIIKLTASPSEGARMISQFAGEYCRTAARHWELPPTHKNRWLMESLCETASLWCLNQMGIDWNSGEDQYKQWAGQGDKLRQHAADQLKDVALFRSPAEFATWLRPSLFLMHKNPDVRELNMIVARQLLPLFGQNPACWEAVVYLNLNQNPDADFQTFLRQWHDNVPSRLRPAVAEISARLGVPVK